MQTAWIGMGQIGRPMALRVLAGGHQLVGYARQPERYGDVRAAGGKVVASATEAVQGAELVCVNLYEEDQFHEALFESGALEALPSGAVLAIHSTVSPMLITQLRDARYDIAVVDAAFSGTASDAAEGRLTLLVGGHPEDLMRASTVFACYSNRIDLVGGSGAGMTVKLVNNLLFAAQLALAREAVQIAIARGADPAKAIGALLHSSGASRALGMLAEEGSEDRLVSMKPYLAKDVRTALEAIPELDGGRLAQAVRSLSVFGG